MSKGDAHAQVIRYQKNIIDTKGYQSSPPKRVQTSHSVIRPELNRKSGGRHRQLLFVLSTCIASSCPLSAGSNFIFDKVNVPQFWATDRVT
ncbi:unnamed protein product [Leptosia nina]|uniref:Uncharacterized protein n=1 Tax=Leptosia nina TaxID=320188 RepID=A0AAV1K092_9NEOP